MRNPVSLLKNEEGTAIVIAVMILLIVTVIGLSSSSTTTSELQIVRNEGIYKQNLYLAEAAAHEAIQRIWNLSRSNPSDLENRTPLWLDTLPIQNPQDLDSDGADGDDNSLVASVDPEASFSVVDVGIASGGSLDVSAESNVHDFAVFGLSADNGGRVFIEIGYRERY
jgi:Tfp pilus assembly protein PilX